MDKHIPETPVKRCTKCGQEFPATIEYFLPRRDRKSGLTSWCRKCYADYEKDRRANPETRSHMLQLDKKRNQKRDKDKLNKRARERYTTDPEYVKIKRERSKNYRKDPIKNERKKQSDKEYRQTERGLVSHSLSHHRRRARKSNLPDRFTSIEWKRCLQYFEYRCAVCGRTEDFWTKLSADHWIPIANTDPGNPGTVASNMIPLCYAYSGAPAGTPTCNLSKQDSDPADWVRRTFDTKEASKILKRISDYFNWINEQDSTN